MRFPPPPKFSRERMRTAALEARKHNNPLVQQMSEFVLQLLHSEAQHLKIMQTRRDALTRITNGEADAKSIAASALRTEGRSL